jgi:hypothetical protein
LLICFKSSQNSGKHFIWVYQLILKDITGAIDKQPIGEDAQKKGVAWRKREDRAPMHFLDMTLSPYLPVFINLQLSQILFFVTFMNDSLCRCD